MAHRQPRVHVGPQGRVVIPAEVRRELHLEPGETLVVRVEEDRLVLERPRPALWMQKAFAQAVPDDVSLADELLAERRAEAQPDEAT